MFADYLRKDLRLVILRILNEMPAYRANSSVIANVLHQFGHSATRDQVKGELRWLCEMDCLSVEEAGQVLVATLKDRGQSAAEGRVVIDGIARPRA
jgi:hypothetical protein